MTDFVHLHLHTEYSLLDGACRIDRLFARVKELGQTAVAMTDHGVLYGAMDFYSAACEAGIKPILGCEVYLAPRTRHDKEYEQDKNPTHLVLLCENNVGWHNLCKLVSRSFTEGFYSKPRVDYELLSTYHEGLICLSACINGRIPRALLARDFEAARAEACRLRDIFGAESFFLEIQDHRDGRELEAMIGLAALGEQLSIPLVATNDAHYLTREDADAQATLMCIQMGTLLSEGRPLGFERDEFYVKSGEEMAERFSEYPEALANTVRIAERCNVQLSSGGLILPHFDVPQGYTDESYLRSLTLAGLEERLAVSAYAEREVYLSRVEEELGIIHSMGFDAYFLIVADFVRAARERGIPVGPGRGSGAGSLVAYCIGITGLDPIRYGLLFERFLNPERVSMPDFDIDFADDRREEVIRYVVEKYGEDHVAQIVTFSVMKSRAAVRDVGRVLGIPYGEVDRISKLIPRAYDVTLEEAYRSTPALRELLAQDTRLSRLYSIARTVEGLPRHPSVHAAAVVICDRPVSDYVPLALNSGSVVTQFSMDTIARLGLLKMDFLGLKYLTILRDAEQLVRRRRPDFSVEQIPEDDADTFAMLSAGHTAGLFQVESAGMTRLISQMKPRSIEDIATSIALYRPGPMESIPRYLACRRDPKKVRYLDEKLVPILSSTDGCIIYQEQVMQIFRALSHYSFGRADVVRRAISKKKMDVLLKEKQDFLSGCEEHGTARAVAEQIFEQIVSFASYAFNKSHAAAYAVLTYRTAYLKCHYPAEYMASLLTHYADGERLPLYQNECNRLGIALLAPCVNHSESRFCVQEGNVRFGLSAIKNVGEGFCEKLIEARAERPFSDFSDFLTRLARVGANRKMIESLIFAGALDVFGRPRSQLIAVCDHALSSASMLAQKTLAGQLDLFSLVSDGAESVSSMDLDYPNLKEYSHADKLRLEKDVCGVYLSDHPLHAYRTLSRLLGVTQIAARQGEGEQTFLGVLSSVRRYQTKTGRAMAEGVLEDTTGQMKLVFFPKVLAATSELLEAGRVLVVRGRDEDREQGEDQSRALLVERVLLPEEAAKGVPSPSAEETDGAPAVTQKKLYLRFSGGEGTIEAKAVALLRRFSGQTAVFFYDRQTRRLRKAENLSCSLTGELIKGLYELLGRENVQIVEK